MATTASITDSRGAASAHRSSSMWANCSLLWNRVWHPALARPGIRPNVFFTAPVIIMNIWVFSLHRLRMPSAWKGADSTSKERTSSPWGKERCSRLMS